MTEASSFSSLLALVDNHLSKTSLSECSNKDTTAGIKSTHQGSLSETKLGQVHLPIPSFSFGDTPIKNILAEQVANMLKAQEQRRDEELENAPISSDSQPQEDSNAGFIDLMQALQNDLLVPNPCVPVNPNNINSISSSLESLLAPKFSYCDLDTDNEESVTPEPVNLPCITDMSYILHEKISRGKCSTFGKVLISRCQPIAAPYLRMPYPNSIQRFDFNKKSPCDLIKEKLRKPCTFNHNI